MCPARSRQFISIILFSSQPHKVGPIFTTDGETKTMEVNVSKFTTMLVT